ncbi:MAG: ChrR family anti-sigma-E factor [Pseudomonadota bacterium]
MASTQAMNDEMMLSYASGTLPAAFDLVVASHLSLNVESRIQVEAMEAVGGAILEKETPIKMSENALSICMSRIETETPKPRKAQSGNYVFPQPLREVVGGDLDSVQWRPIGGGVKQAILPCEGDSSVRLLSIPGGTAIPEHSHEGMELTLVLRGAFVDGQTRYGRGDMEYADDHTEHQPIAEDGETCICLTATDAPLKFNDLIPRILQPFAQI